MAQDPNLDDRTSIGRVAQGGNRRQGRSIWWFLAVTAVTVGVLAFAAWLNRTAPVGQGATSGSGGAPASATPSSAKP